MAYATQVTISTGNKVSMNDQSQEVSVTVGYQLEREDTDVVNIVKEKSVELALAHRAAWQALRDTKVSAVQDTTRDMAKETSGIMPEASVRDKELGSAPAVTLAATTDTPLDSFQTTEAAKASSAISPAPVERIKPGQVAALLLLLSEAQWTEQQRHEYLREKFSCGSVHELDAEQAREWLLELQRAEREANQKAAQQRRLENAHRNGTPS